MHRVTGWARSVVVVLRVWVAHVRLVIGTVEVLAIPAVGEEDLRAQTARAVVGRDVVGLSLA